MKNKDFGYFFNSCPVVLSNAAPDRPDTAHPQRAPDAHYTRPGQAGLRRTVQKIMNYYWFFGKGRSGFVLTTVMQKPTSWRGPQRLLFAIKNNEKLCFSLFLNAKTVPVAPAGRRCFCCFCMTVVKTKPDQKTSINSLSPHRRETAGTNPTCILRAGSAVSKYARAPGCGLCAGKYRRYEC